MPAVITGLGAVSAVGRGVSRLWSAMAEGRDGIRPLRRFDPAEVGVALAGLIEDRNDPDQVDGAPLCVELALDAIREAWRTARLDEVPRDRIALVFGSSLGERDVHVQEITQELGDTLGITGPRLTISTACTSSTNAIGLGLDLLALGTADIVIAGGADVLGRRLLAGFHALGVLSQTKCAPFSEPAGTSLGEGAGFLVLERDASRARGSHAVYGYGLSADAFHDTGPDPSGTGIARALRSALTHAGVAPNEIDYVNAHGTGTQANDPAEWRAMQQVFGAHAERLPISSSKSFLGHAQGAAGALETIATLVAMEHGAIPPTQQFTVARPNSPRDPVGQATARPGAIELAVCTNSAFGGANCAVVIGRTDERRLTPTIQRRPVSIIGCSAVGPHGVRLDDVLTAHTCGRVRDLDLETVLPSANPRSLDPVTRYVLGSAALALADAGARIRGEARDRAGIVFGVISASDEASTGLQRTIDQHGYRGLSAQLFSRQVLNAPAGTCSKLFGLRGAMSTVCAGDATGLLAIIYAAELLSARTDNDLLLAIGADELAATDEPPEASEGAACLALTATSGAVEVTGWGIAGPGQLARAVAAARAMAGVDAVDIVIGDPIEGAARAIDPVQLVGASSSFTSALGVVAATLLVRTGAVRTVLVTRSGGRSADCAIVISAGAVHAS